MDAVDIIFVVISLTLLAYQIRQLIGMQKTAVIRGTVPGRTGAAILVAVVLVVAIVKRNNVATSWPVYLSMGILCVAYLIGGAALSETGMYCNGRFLRYENAAYFLIEREDTPQPVLRLSRGGREGCMIIKPDQKEEITRFMREKGVPTAQEYRDHERQGIQRQAQRRAQKKAAKKK